MMFISLLLAVNSCVTLRALYTIIPIIRNYQRPKKTPFRTKESYPASGRDISFRVIATTGHRLMTRPAKPKPQAQRPLETLLKPSEAAVFLGCHTNTLRNWRTTGTGPRFVQHSGRTIRYRIADLLDHREVATP